MIAEMASTKLRTPEEVRAILEKPTSTLWNLSRGQSKELASAFASTITGYALGDPHRREQQWLNLFCIPKEYIPKIRERSRKNGPPRERTAPSQLPDRHATTAARLAKMGHLSRAMKTLLRDDVASSKSPAQIAAELAALHPTGAPIQPIPRSAKAAWGALDPDDILAAVRKGRRASAPGPSGWTEELLYTVLANSPDSSSHDFAAMTKDILNGEVSSSVGDFLRASRLVAIPKEDGTRPIAIGEVFTRVACTLAMARVGKHLESAVAPLQRALSAGGAESIVHEVRGRQDAGENTLCIDFCNAFNTVSRKTAVAEAIANPQLRPIHKIVDLLYAQPSRLEWHIGGEHGTILSQEGVRQGDVLGPALFCLALRGVIADCPCPVFCYMDDLTICEKDPAKLVTVALELARRAAVIGLKVNPKKTKASGPNSTQIASELKIVDAGTPGQKLLGAWIGTAAAQEKFLDQCLDKHKIAFDRLRLLDNESSYALLRFSAHARFNHLARTHKDTSTHARKFDELCVSHVEHITGAKVDASSRQLLHLPTSKGGGGVRQYEWIAPSAYHASLQKQTQEELTAIVDGAIIDQLDTKTAEHRRRCAKTNASSWLAGPSEESKLSDEEFATALRCRLLLPDSTERTCPCGFEAPSAPDRETHLLGCTHRNGIGPATRHNMLRDLVADLARERGFTTMLEPTLADGRADLALLHPSLPEPMVIDFTVTNTAAMSNPTGAQAEARKKRRYGKRDLVVAQIDVSGGFSQALSNCVKTIATDPDDQRALTQRISKVVQKGNARILLDDRDRRSSISLTALNLNTPLRPPKSWSSKREKKARDDNQTTPSTPRQRISLDDTQAPPTNFVTASTSHDPGPPPPTQQAAAHLAQCTGASLNDSQRNGASSEMAAASKPTA
jgi:hypothetical protein